MCFLSFRFCYQFVFRPPYSVFLIPSQEPVINCFLLFAVCHICLLIVAFSYHLNGFTFCHFEDFIKNKSKARSMYNKWCPIFQCTFHVSELIWEILLGFYVLNTCSPSVQHLFCYFNVKISTISDPIPTIKFEWTNAQTWVSGLTFVQQLRSGLIQSWTRNIWTSLTHSCWLLSFCSSLFIILIPVWHIICSH